MEEVWKDLSLTTPSLSLLPLEPTSTNTTSSTTNAASSFSLTCQDFLRAPLPRNAQRFSPENSELKFVLEKHLDKGVTSTSSPATEDSSVDRRRKRVMKNRESAARSRARKQAYTKQLQLEVGNLERENKMLRDQYQELLRQMRAQAPAPAPAPATQKDALQRTLSAPY